jgi:O-antigen/teichoic acid export membrane protein
LSARSERYGKLLVRFAGGQVTLQVIQAVNGLIFVWLLAINDFAVYAIFTGTMGLSAVMLSLGITPTMIALIGPSVQDGHKVGRYFYAALHLRLLLLLPVSLLGLSILVYSTIRMDCPSHLIVVLSLTLLACNFLSAQTDLYGAPLQMTGRLGRLYQWAVLAELIKLGVVVLLWWSELLNAVSASLVAALSLGCNYWGLRLSTQRHIVRPNTAPTKEQAELWHLTLPNLPNAIFGALQGQITILVAALLGNTAQIASIGALSRLARLLTFLQAANPMILGPALARLPAAKFWRVLPVVLACAALIAVGIALSGVFLPQWLIMLLGSNYQGLKDVVWIVTVGAGLGYFLVVVGTVNSFRHLVAWWASFATIGVVVCAQVGAALTFDLRTVAGVLSLGIAANCARTTMLFVVMLAARFRPAWLRGVNHVSV